MCAAGKNQQAAEAAAAVNATAASAAAGPAKPLSGSVRSRAEAQLDDTSDVDDAPQARRASKCAHVAAKSAAVAAPKPAAPKTPPLSDKDRATKREHQNVLKIGAELVTKYAASKIKLMDRMTVIEEMEDVEMMWHENNNLDIDYPWRPGPIYAAFQRDVLRVRKQLENVNGLLMDQLAWCKKHGDPVNPNPAPIDPEKLKHRRVRQLREDLRKLHISAMDEEACNAHMTHLQALYAANKEEKENFFKQPTRAKHIEYLHEMSRLSYDLEMYFGKLADRIGLLKKRKLQQEQENYEWLLERIEELEAIGDEDIPTTRHECEQMMGRLEEPCQAVAAMLKQCEEREDNVEYIDALIKACNLLVRVMDRLQARMTVFEAIKSLDHPLPPALVTRSAVVTDIVAKYLVEPTSSAKLANAIREVDVLVPAEPSA
jgi:hypothetical protein